MVIKSLTRLFSSVSSDPSRSPDSSTPPIPPISSRRRTYWPVRQPLPQQWLRPISTTNSTTTTTTITTTTSGTTSTSATCASTMATNASLSTASTSSPTATTTLPASNDLSMLQILHTPLNGTPCPLSQPSQRFTLTAACPFPWTLQNGQPHQQSLRSLQQLVFASSAVSTASAWGRVFGRPLQAKDTVPCSPSNCTQLQRDLQLQQAQCPSHKFQQQCPAHKRFRLFRQKVRKCPVHAVPQYVLPPNTVSVSPLAVPPENILLEEEDSTALAAASTSAAAASKSTMTPSTSFSSRLSSFSTVSLALSISSFSLGSDGEGYNSSTFQSSKKQKKKKLSKKEKEQQKQQQRCLCFLEATRMDQQNDLTAAPEPKPQASIYRYQKETNRLKKMWNESTIFHWTKSRSQPLEQQQQPQQQPQQHGYDFSAQPSYIQHSHHLADEMHGEPMRNSLSGTDISDEGNHTLSDAEDEDDSEPSSIEMGRPSHISFQEHYGSKARMPRPGDDLKAISRHQAALSQQAATDFSSYRMNDLPSSSNPLESRPLASAFVVEEEDDDEDLDWDAQSVQSDSGAPSSSPMYSAEAREPTSYSTVTLPLSPPAKSHLRKPSSANLRGRHRGMSLPGDSSSSFLKNKENWDDDFDFAGDINVPTKVVENQMSLQMDLDNIKDFASQIEDLKVLRTSLRKASSSLRESNIKNHQDLFELFQKDYQRDWEQAEVIINLGEIAQTSDATTSTGPVAAGPLSLLSGKSLKSSISRASSQRLRRPALSTTTGGLAPTAINTTFDMPSSLALDPKSRSLSQSSTLTGTTLAGSESDLPSRISSRSSTETSIGIESTVEDLVITPTLEKRRPYLGSGVEPLQQASLMKSSTSCPAGFGHCTTPVTPLPHQYQEINEDATGELNYGLNDVEPNRSWKQHGKEDSSETIKGVPRDDMMQSEVDASLRRYQKSSKKMKRPTYPKLVEYDNEDEDQGYESYGPGGSSSSSGSGSRGEGSSSSISMITPIPSDRHMQVLKDILVEGLGTDVAGKYMFKHGEQDHVRFSVEVIPGLLGHLKGLQERLGDQLNQLNQLMKHQEQLVAAV